MRLSKRSSHTEPKSSHDELQDSKIVRLKGRLISKFTKKSSAAEVRRDSVMLEQSNRRNDPMRGTPSVVHHPDSTRSETPTSRVNLLQLPGEIRNRIYEEVIGGRSICLTTRHEKCVGEIAKRRTPPGAGYNSDDEERGALRLLYVCRQIYLEARFLVFSLNLFRYSNAIRDLAMWELNQRHAMSLIAAVRLYSNGSTNEMMWINGLKYFPNLRRVEIAVASHEKSTRTPQDPDGYAAKGEWEESIETAVKGASNESVKVVFYKRFRC